MGETADALPPRNLLSFHEFCARSGGVPAQPCAGGLADGECRRHLAHFDPTGHEAVYFARICAASETTLRRCEPGELGVVIARYKGIAGYDWLAVPLLPYLYSVEDPPQVPARVNHEMVESLRQRYHEAHLMGLGEDVPEGGRVQRGWNQLVGAAYERRIYAFRLRRRRAQDDAFIAWMNAGPNRSHFNIVFRNAPILPAQFWIFIFRTRSGGTWLPTAGSPRRGRWPSSWCSTRASILRSN